MLRRIGVSLAVIGTLASTLMPEGAWGDRDPRDTSEPHTVPVIGHRPGHHPGVATTSCNDDGECGSAVFAICDPDPGQPCVGPYQSSEEMGPRVVSLVLHAWPADTTVHVWWLGVEPASGSSVDCTKGTGAARTPLGDVTTDGVGAATATISLPPGEQGQEWDYGSNWVCATTAAEGVAAGVWNQSLFTIYAA